MQELLFGPLLLTWGPAGLAFIKQHPWQMFAAVLVFVLLMDLMFRKRSSSGGDGGIVACSTSAIAAATGAAAIEAGR